MWGFWFYIQVEFFDTIHGFVLDKGNTYITLLVLKAVILYIISGHQKCWITVELVPD